MNKKYFFDKDESFIIKTNSACPYCYSRNIIFHRNISLSYYINKNGEPIQKIVLSENKEIKSNMILGKIFRQLLQNQVTHSNTLIRVCQDCGKRQVIYNHK